MRQDNYIPKSCRSQELPRALYHGSAYYRGVLQPGFFTKGSITSWGEPRQGKLDRGFGVETNHYLYATTQRERAEDFAVLRALELLVAGQMNHFAGESGLVLQFEVPFTREILRKTIAYLYLIAPLSEHCWVQNRELEKVIQYQEWRTRRTVYPVDVERVDLDAWMQRHQVVVVAPQPQELVHG